MNIPYLVSDADGALKNGFLKIWPNGTTITCYFHMMKNVKEFNFRSATNLKLIQEHLRQLMQSPSTQHFEKGCDLFLKKCRKLKDTHFADYFQRIWLNAKNKNWHHGLINFIPTTNNAIESTNKRIKDDFNLRVKQPMSAFKTIIMDVLRTYSLEYTDGTRNFNTELHITRDQYNKAFQWAVSKKTCIIKKSQNATCYYLPPGTEDKLDRKILNLFKKMNYKISPSSKKIYIYMWMVKISNVENVQHKIS